MKNITLFLAMTVMSLSSYAQLYSSGNNVISGNNIGIGTNAPAANLHVRGTGSSNVDEFRIQHINLTSGASRISFFNDAQSTFSATADYAVLNKYAKGVAGNYATGFKFAQLFSFANSQGSLIFNTAGNIGFGTFNQATSTTITRLFIDSLTGNIGIGSSSPTNRLLVQSASTSDAIKLTNTTSGSTATDGVELQLNGNAATLMNRENSTLGLGTNNTNRMTIDASGRVIIGTTTTPTGYKLYVETGILTEKVKVALKSSSNWADYVFADDYKLQSLAEVEQYVNKHKHLPGIPSANEVVMNGLDLGAMDAKLLEKIEELTLHMIRLEKQVNQLEKENASLKQPSSINQK